MSRLAQRGRPTAAALVAALGLLLALSSCSAGASGAGTRSFTVGGQAAVEIAPAGTPRGLVIYLHGFGDDATVITGAAKRTTVVQRLVDAGYVVAASDAHGDAWGNAASQADHVALAGALRARHHTTATFLLAESMGSVAALRIVAGHQIADLAGAAFVSPFIDYRLPLGPDYEASVRAAFGGALPADADNPALLPAADFAGTHLRFYVATDDEVTVTSQQAQPLFSRLQGIADESYRTCTGGHVAASCFQADDLVAWYDGLLSAG